MFKTFLFLFLSFVFLYNIYRKNTFSSQRHVSIETHSFYFQLYFYFATLARTWGNREILSDRDEFPKTIKT